ncbi:MAG: nitroreductase [Rhodobacteraceae bacterium]|nr:nitroreductase [Paracoccaceae bacterium]
MPAARPDVVDFLLTRRSRPAKTLVAPGPDRAALAPLLTAALRVPDHGKLEPWRLIVLERGALDRLAETVAERGAALGLDEATIAKQAQAFSASPCCVAVIAAPKPSAKIPQIEQLHSAGAACLSLLNAALASGWGANWLTGWAAHDRTFLTEALALGADETVAGFVHIGTETSTPPERPRPDVATLTQWMDR